MPGNPALWRLRQEDGRSQDSLGYIVRACLEPITRLDVQDKSYMISRMPNVLKEKLVPSGLEAGKESFAATWMMKDGSHSCTWRAEKQRSRELTGRHFSEAWGIHVQQDLCHRAYSWPPGYNLVLLQLTCARGHPPNKRSRLLSN